MTKIALAAVVLALFSCQSKPQPETLTAPALEAAMQDDSAQVGSTIVLAMNTDPVCGMPVDEERADTAMFNGKIYGFCSEGCKEEFLMAPESYLKK